MNSDDLFQENRVLYQCLAEQKSSVKESLRDKCNMISSFQFELSELKKQILVLMTVLAPTAEQQGQENGVTDSPLSHSFQHLEELGSFMSEYDKVVMVQRNKTLELNFRKELKKVHELEQQISQLTESNTEAAREREELIEKNVFIEEENHIQREQIALLEETIRCMEDELEEIGLKTKELALETVATQTDLSRADIERKEDQLDAIAKENVEDLLCLAHKVAELQLENDDLDLKFNETKQELGLLQHDYHERGRIISGLENELNGLKLISKATATDNSTCRECQGASPSLDVGNPFLVQAMDSPSNPKNDSIKLVCRPLMPLIMYCIQINRVISFCSQTYGCTSRK